MALRYFGKDPESDMKGSPTVFVDEVTADLVIQGWKASEETLTECREVGTVPDHEAVVRVPARMVTILREACDDAERAHLR
ncbi:hypothetical protein [Nocardiopsis dassonvillei]|uniref:Uncharacterized protein n=1 Tax=Nocardiopsis dassonvillei (strain ATCC 23218 / DSM 43111 / CIP 107115 / JCM 7437 / KCTC 9190 / NBRC 14626 / NCTC 10488 / NRRL B-5397 / IMRU 509) TaxID=446468 RepID=D7AWJ9_NOCDD|nr:hypothetical protein [Nocardiopsis dassonvillei]ADH67796.1 conserved hypothetical protein [Nocardiopsis dassonvillei subsp. dassonvillei DSM 43111]APC35963.1 hypothetical protein A9R04_15270 [Nocardiopsis dassonvillei]NKY80573.1 hypothetical protein [Nocardiopsis dassonvillei]VEI88293.1 Uncharacterised protein [Nocardiopsis dassonvillei]